MEIGMKLGQHERLMCGSCLSPSALTAPSCVHLFILSLFWGMSITSQFSV